jgi:hypothetical protein
MTALFITDQKLKSFTGIDENVDPALLYPFVLQSQDTWIQTTCGTKLYEKLKQLVVDKMIYATDIPEAYQTLLDDYIAPTVVHYSYYAALPTLKYRTTNKGILSGTSEVAQGITLEELQYLRNSIFDTAKFYNERLRDYLVWHMNDYPEYKTYNSQDGMAANKGTSYYTGLAIPKKRYGYYEEDDCNGCNNTPLN